MATYQTESRDDLEQRFLIMGQIVLRARAHVAECVVDHCPACEALCDAVALPDTVLAVAHEPREDLESAVRAINDRIETVAATSVDDCPAQAFIRHLLDEASARL